MESSRKGLQNPPEPDRTQLTFAGGGTVKLCMEALLSFSDLVFFRESDFSESLKRHSISYTECMISS